MSRKEETCATLACISKDTQAIWNGTYFHSPFREKVDKVVGESGGGLLKNETCNVQRIKTVWESDSVKELALEWKDIISRPIELPLSKSAEISNKLRQEGNEFYKMKNFRTAQKGFTLSLCFAPTGSKEEVLAYSNRSASFMEMNEKENCMSDIEKALEVMDNPAFKQSSDLNAVRAKLLERMTRCDKMGGNKMPKNVNANLDQFFSMKSPSQIIEAAEDFVEIQDKPGRGRHVVVKRDVSPGTILILEEPYSKVLIKQLRWEIDFCHFCFKDISRSPSVPCRGCVFALYCNYNCLLMDSAQHEFYECKMSQFLHLLQLKRLVHLAYRTLIKLGPKNLYEFWKKDKSSNRHSILGFDEEGKYRSSSYYPINCLIYHDHALLEKELRQYSIDSILVIEVLDQKTDFFKSVQYDSDDEDEVRNFKYFAASIIMLSQLSFPCNAHSLSYLKLDNNNPTADDIVAASVDEIGAGAFALLSMINHSCDPNVVRIDLVNGVNAVIAIKMIKAGDEVLDNYGVHFALQDHPKRAKHLLNYYHFTCDCLACRNKWPKIEILKTMTNKFMCQNCSGQFKLAEYFKKSYQDCIIDRVKNWCKKCSQTYDVNVLQQNVQKRSVDFASAYDLLLQNKPMESIPSLLECLAYLESHVVPPCITVNYIQETLKQALNMLAINY